MLIKRIIFNIFILIIFLPLMQKINPFVNLTPLMWNWVSEEKPKLTSKNWFSGEFQKNYDKYIEQHIGFRPFFVRMRNQIQYTLYKSSTASSIVLGKNNFLYEKEYVRSFNGDNYNGREIMDYNVNSLKIIKDTLKKRNNIDLIVVLAPGKASVYPEYLPNKYIKKNRGITNYEYYSKILKESGIHTIDFNKYFKTIKDPDKPLLFSAQGMHWSRYGAVIAFDSIVRYIEKLRSIDLTDIKLEGVKYSNIKIGSEYDLGIGLNVMGELPHPKYAHPIISFNKENKKDTCALLSIGDSFFFTFREMYLPNYVFPNWDFWYYGMDMVNHQYKNVNTIDYQKEIEKYNVIIIMASEASLTVDKFPYCFVEKCNQFINNPIK
jgi:hypothetical protein